MQPLMGLAEVRALLGVSRQRADQIIRKPGFPPPVAELKTGKIWDAGHVQRWATKDGRVPLATQVKVLNTAATYIQWKGTGSICMDFWCTCGAMPHVHGDFAYAVRCVECGTVWMMPDTFRLEKAEPSYSGVVIQAYEEWYAACIFDTAAEGQPPSPCDQDAVYGSDYCPAHRVAGVAAGDCGDPIDNVLLRKFAEAPDTPKEA